MARLTKGMYGDAMNPITGLFGLRTGQIHHSDRFDHNTGWFNTDGERLGWGDLSKADLARISQELEDGEVLIILGERETFVETNSEAPGADYVAGHATYAITRNELYRIDRNRCAMRTAHVLDGVRFTVILPEALKQLMIAGTRA